MDWADDANKEQIKKECLRKWNMRWELDCGFQCLPGNLAMER